MSVSLREIDSKNFRACINLKVAAGQEHFVAANVVSIAESKIYPYFNPLAVYKDEELVGFAMYGRDPETEKLWIVRLMIAENFQGRGFGRLATRELIRKMRALPKADEIFLSFVPANTGAEKLYTSVGFERTGEIEAGEIVMRLAMENN